MRPFSLKIFLPDGIPDGLKIIEKSNWIGCGVVFPRSLFPDRKHREEFNRTGVYVLVGPAEEGDLPTIYIGEGDPVKPRLEQHYAKKDFWTWGVFFNAKDGSLNKAHVQHLEARLVQLAGEAKRATLDNGNKPQLPALSEPEKADAESFLADILSIFPLIGLTSFEKPAVTANPKSNLKMEGKGIKAEGHESPQGFVVLKGSRSVIQETASIHAYMKTLRAELKANGVLVEQDGSYLFSQDYVFNSPSTAAGVVLGRAANGRTEWKDAKNRTLKEIQEQQVTLTN